MKKTKRKYDSFIASLEQIYKGQENHNFEEYKDPIKQYIQNSYEKEMAGVAEALGISSSLLSKWLGDRPLTLNKIKDICGALKVSLPEIIIYYENTKPKDEDNKNDTGQTEDKPDNSLNIVKTSDLLGTLPTVISKNLSLPFDQSLYSPWLGTYYCYFPSNHSKVTRTNTKMFPKLCKAYCEDKDYEELYNLYRQENNIHSGILCIEQPSKGNYCLVSLKYLIEPDKGLIEKYTGRATIFSSKPGLYMELESKESDGFIYAIFDTRFNIKITKKTELSMGMILSSSESNRPCASRIIISRKERFDENKRYHYILRSNLMLNDSVIRIDTFGYREFVAHIKKLSENNSEIESKELKKIIENLNKFVDRYPTLGEFTYSHDTPKKECAFIDSKKVKQFFEKSPDYTELDGIYFDSFIRLHSLSPWFSKVNAEKAKDFYDILGNSSPKPGQAKE